MDEIRETTRTIKINVPFDEIITAFEGSTATNHFFIDVKESRILNINEETLYQEVSFEEVDNDIERYLSIPEKISAEEFMRMEQFIMEIDDQNIREELFNAIKKKKPFRNFKNALLNYPNFRNLWFEYHNKEIENAARFWLKQNNIELASGEVRITKEFGVKELFRTDLEKLDKSIRRELERFSPHSCRSCGLKHSPDADFSKKLFMIDALPECQMEEGILKEEMRKKFSLDHFWTSHFDESNITVLAAAKCPRCGSDDIFFDF